MPRPSCYTMLIGLLAESFTPVVLDTIACTDSITDLFPRMSLRIGENWVVIKIGPDFLRGGTAAVLVGS